MLTPEVTVVGGIGMQRFLTVVYDCSFVFNFWWCLLNHVVSRESSICRHWLKIELKSQCCLILPVHRGNAKLSSPNFFLILQCDNNRNYSLSSSSCYKLFMQKKKKLNWKSFCLCFFFGRKGISLRGKSHEQKQTN